LYYPSSLPFGYHIDKSSIQKTSDQSIQFNIVHGSNTIEVIESTSGGNASGEAMVNAKFSESKPVTTPYGKAQVGYINAQHKGTVGSLVTKDGSWIMATTAGDKPALSSFASLLKGFKPQ
jgi:hypothetical protein